MTTDVPTFTELEGETVILRRKGTYFQAKVYSLNGRLFARVGAGFVGLNVDRSTTVAGLMVESMALGRAHTSGSFGRLYLAGSGK